MMSTNGAHPLNAIWASRSSQNYRDERKELFSAVRPSSRRRLLRMVDTSSLPALESGAAAPAKGGFEISKCWRGQGLIEPRAWHKGPWFTVLRSRCCGAVRDRPYPNNHFSTSSQRGEYTSPAGVSLTVGVIGRHADPELLSRCANGARHFGEAQGTYRAFRRAQIISIGRRGAGLPCAGDRRILGGAWVRGVPAKARISGQAYGDGRPMMR